MVDVINAATCSAKVRSGCQVVARATAGTSPTAAVVDEKTDTIYVTNSVTDGSGCGRASATTKVGSSAFWAAVDQAHHSVYVANDNDGTVSVINSTVCNARVTSGCGQAWPTVTTGANPDFVALDPSSGTVFAVNHFDDTLPVIDTRRCNGTTTSGCGGRARNEQATPEQDPGFNSFPNAVTLVPQTGSAYVLNVGGRNVLSVVSVSHCNATDTSGCRTEAPSVPDREATISADP